MAENPRPLGVSVRFRSRTWSEPTSSIRPLNGRKVAVWLLWGSASCVRPDLNLMVSRTGRHRRFVGATRLPFLIGDSIMPRGPPAPLQGPL